MRQRVWRNVAVMLVAIALGGQGCKSTSSKNPADATIEGMKQVRESLLAGNKQIDANAAAMAALSNTSNVKKSIAKFDSELKNTESMAQKARDRAADMRKRGAQYVAAWEGEMANVTSAELRTAMKQRQQRVRENFADIRTASRAAGDAYEPYIAALKELQSALSLDQTAEGVKSAAPTISTAVAAGQKLKQKIHACVVEIDGVMGSMASMTPSPAPSGTAAPAK